MTATPTAVPSLDLRPTRCAICETEGNADVLFPATFDPSALNPAVFSARRVPDRTHYRLMRCRSCGLVRSDPIADPSLLPDLYARAEFHYGGELDSLRETYGAYLARLSALGARTGALLEIGCGNGFLLEEALRQGWASVSGVEPSEAAVAEAPPAVRERIVCDVMRRGLFDAEALDAVCMFQTLDHIAEPAALLDECFRVLRPNGMILCLNHDVEALSARVLREHSPIFDIEHTYLYSRRTLGRLLEKHGFRVRDSGRVLNRYSVQYLAQLLPVPAAPKRRLLGLLQRTPIGKIRATVPLGNLFVIGQKPA